MTDAAYQARLADALLELSRMLAQGSAFVLACDHCAKAWRVGYRDLEAAWKAAERALEMLRTDWTVGTRADVFRLLADALAAEQPQPDEYNRRLRRQLEQEWAELRALRKAEQPLPVAFTCGLCGIGDYYIAEHLRLYGAAVERAARAAAFREAAEVCDTVAAGARQMDGLDGDYESGIEAGAEQCADALRARAEGQSNG